MANVRPVARDGNWIIFDQAALRPEVVEYFWGQGFQPTQNELYSRSDLNRRSGDLILPDTHWQLAQSGFAARPDLYRRMRPGVQRELDQLSDRGAGRAPERPGWIPADVWRRFLSAGDGVHRYRDASELGTDIILIRRDGAPTGGYAEAPSDIHVTSRLLRVAPASELRRILGGESSRQAAARWAAQTAPAYNTFMWRSVQQGTSPRRARLNYHNETRRRFAAAFIPLIGFAVPAGHPAGEQLGAVSRLWQTD